MSYNKAKLTEKITTIDLKTTKRIEQLNLGFLFAYKIFPDNILTFLTQWKDEKGGLFVQKLLWSMLKRGLKFNKLPDFQPYIGSQWLALKQFLVYSL